MVVTMLCELLQCASFYYLGYEGQVANWSVICVSCTLFLCCDEGFYNSSFPLVAEGTFVK